jgi:hypothetical protein
MDHQSSFLVTTKECHNMVQPADAEEHEVLSLRGQERAENRILVNAKLGLSVPWSQPRSPDADKREPPITCRPCQQSRGKKTPDASN